MNFRLLLNVRSGNTTVFHIHRGSNERLQARLILDAVRESLHVHDGPLTALYTVCLPVLDFIHTLKFPWRANVTLIKDDYNKLYIHI